MHDGICTSSRRPAHTRCTRLPFRGYSSCCSLLLVFACRLSGVSGQGRGPSEGGGCVLVGALLCVDVVPFKGGLAHPVLVGCWAGALHIFLKTSVVRTIDCL
jgi:hypothetical protein